MANRTAEQLLHEFLGNTGADVTMSLLRSPNAPLHLALMAALTFPRCSGLVGCGVWGSSRVSGRGVGSFVVDG